MTLIQITDSLIGSFLGVPVVRATLRAAAVQDTPGPGAKGEGQAAEYVGPRQSFVYKRHRPTTNRRLPSRAP